MRIAAQLMPALLVLALTVLAAVPLGVDGNARLVLPQLPFLVIAHVTLTAHERMPVWTVFASGLLLDLLTNGPLGYWAFVYLAGHQAIAWLPVPSRPSLSIAWLTLAPVVISLNLLEWGVNSLYQMALAPARPRIVAALVAIAAYPLIAALRSPSGAARRRRHLQLERGS